VKRPPLLARFPSLRSRAVSHPVVPDDAAQRYPALADDLAVVRAVVAGPFAESDRAALVHQNRYRRQQVLIVLGSAALTGLGGLQAVLPDQRWPGVLLAVLGLAVAALGRGADELGTFEAFLTERVKAERLRAAHFRYLSRTGRYAGADREAVLRRSVRAVKAGEEPT